MVRSSDAHPELAMLLYETAITLQNVAPLKTKLYDVLPSFQVIRRKTPRTPLGPSRAWGLLHPKTRGSLRWTPDASRTSALRSERLC